MDNQKSNSQIIGREVLPRFLAWSLLRLHVWHVWLACFLLMLAIFPLIRNHVGAETLGFLYAVLVAPVLLGSFLAMLSYYESGYATAIREHFLKRASRGRVSLVLVMSADGHVLMNRQEQEPFLGRWVFLGGYARVGETLRGTAVRRIKEITGVEFDLSVDEVLAESSDSLFYEEYVTDYYSLQPVPTTVFFARTRTGDLLPRAAVPTEQRDDLRWWSIGEIARDRGLSIPNYLREVVLTKAGLMRFPELWTVNGVALPAEIEEAWRAMVTGLLEEPAVARTMEVQDVGFTE